MKDKDIKLAIWVCRIGIVLCTLLQGLIIFYVGYSIGERQAFKSIVIGQCQVDKQAMAVSCNKYNY